MKDESPATMRALVLETFGAPFKLATVARPEAGHGEVLVRIKASGVNPLDTKIRSGNAGHAKVQLPAILGMDLAGVVEQVGGGVTQFKVGDEVYGMTGGIGGVQGTLAEYAAVDADLLALKPKNYTMRQAAAIPLVFITAWEGLVDRANVQAGQKVLVHGGSGGVGHMVIQIANAKDAIVFATDSTRNQQKVKDLGAVAIDYNDTTVEEYMAAYTEDEGFDIVYDTIGGATLDASFRAVRYYTGHVVSILGWGTHSLAPLSFRGATYSGVFTLLPILSGKHRAHHGDILRHATRMAEAGQLLPILHEEVFSLENGLDAHASLENKKANGKVVVNVAE